MEVLSHTFYCNFGRDIEIISFVISRTSLNRGSLNRGSTVPTKSKLRYSILACIEYRVDTRSPVLDPRFWIRDLLHVHVQACYMFCVAIRLGKIKDRFLQI